MDAPDTPLGIVGFASRPQLFKGPYIVLRNFSNRSVTRFRLEATITTPHECASQGVPDNYYSNREFDQMNILAGSSGRVYWNLLGPQNLVWAAKGETGSYVQLQISISEVEFADGAVWKRKTPDAAFLTPEELSNMAPPGCLPWRDMDKALAGVTEVRSRADARPGYKVVPPATQHAAFAFSCRIVGNAAICPANYGAEKSSGKE